MTDSFSSIKNEPPIPEKKDDNLKSPIEQIQENLKSDDQKKIVTGLKTLLAYMSKGEVIPDIGPSVVILLSHKDEEIRHLASIVCVMMQETNSEILLLSVGNFVKSAFESDPSNRAISLKTFTSLKIPDLFTITLEQINNLSSDMSPFVRRAAAIACTKLCDENNKDQFIPILKRMLNDQSPIVISATLYALSVIAPDNDEIMHPYFRSLCNELQKLDEWGQTIALNTLTRYSRRNFRDPKKLNLDDWDDNAYESLDPDLDLLLQAAQPLLSSINPSVTLSASILYFYLSPPLKRNMFVKPMIRLIYGDSSVQCIALSVLSSMVADDPEPFLPHIRHFFVNDDDPRDAKLLKFKVLSQLARPMNAQMIMEELYQHVTTRDRELSHAAVLAIGRTASFAGKLNYNSFTQLMRLLNSPLNFVVSSAVLVICVLLSPLPQESDEAKEEDPLFGDISEPSMDAGEVTSVLKKMLTFFGKIDDPEAKSALIAVIGAKAKIVPLQAHEVLRQLAITFPQQDRLVKLQTITLAARVFAVRSKESADLVRFVFSQGLYDTDIDIRDRVRLCHSLISAQTNSPTILKLRKRCDEFLFPHKPAVVWDNASQKASIVDLGTFSQVLGLPEAAPCVPWADPESLPPSSVRDGETHETQSNENATNQNDEEKDRNEEEDYESFFGEKEKPSKPETDEDIILQTQTKSEVVHQEVDIDEDYFN